MGAFDDLIPKSKAPEAPSVKPGAGAFDDLIPKKPAPGVAETAARSAVQGLTFGLADESYGLTQGIKGMMTGEGFRAGYDRGVNEFRANDKAGREANPVTGVLAEVAGGIGTGLGAARAGATLIRGGMALPEAIGRGALEGAAYGGLHSAGNAEGGVTERFDAAKDGALTGALVGGAVPVVARGVGAAVNRASAPFAAPAERQAALAVLEREGVPVSAGQRSGNKALQYAESFLGDAPFSGGQATRAVEAQGEAFTDAAMRRVGAGGRASSDNIAAVRTRIGQEFTDLAARNTVQADRQMGQELGLALREYDRVLPAEQRRIVGELASDVVERFQAHNGALPGRDYQTIRSRLSRMSQNARVNDPEFSQAIRSLRDALDNNMSRSVAPEDAAAWQQARREWGNLKVIERASTGGGEAAAGGLISPAQLRIAASQGAGNRSSYARGDGEFSELARAGQQIMTPLPNSGTAQRNLMTGIVGGGGGAVAVGGDPLIAAVVAAGPAVIGRALWAGPVQRYLSGQPITPQVRALIESRARAALQGGAQSQSHRLNSPRD